METTLHWKEKMAFEADSRGMKCIIDAFPEAGGENKGPTPKELLLNAVMGCTAMDVISMLVKMRTPPKSFSMKAVAEKTTVPPVHFPRIDLQYHLEGEIDKEKVIKAVTLSMTKYCGVSFMVSHGPPIYYSIFLNGLEIGAGQAFPNEGVPANG